MNNYEKLVARVRAVRRSLWMQVLGRGLSWFLIALGACLVGGILLAWFSGFQPAALWFVRLATFLFVVAAAIWFIWRPLRRRISEVQIAQFIEERYPQLEDRLVSAVEFGKAPSAGMTGLLVDDAAAKTARLDFLQVIDRRRVAISSLAGLATAAAVICLILFGPSMFRYGFDLLYLPWAQAADRSGLSIEVLPGDLETPKGSDVLIHARLVGFDSPEVRLSISGPATATGSEIRMEPESTGSGFQYLLADLKETVSYRVEARGVRSATFQLKVQDLPRVEKISLDYTFPAYTGLPPQHVEDEGDITGIRGSRVVVGVRASGPARAARLLFEDGTSTPMAPAGAREFKGSLTLQKTGSYVVQFEEGLSKARAGSPEYSIDVVEDAPPQVTIQKPMRDTRATSVEEVFTEARAEDDIGVTRLELRYSVNGGPEKTLPLNSGKTSGKSVIGTHTFSLEEYGLVPGDLISYYARAADNNSASGPGNASSDIYFIQVRPFEQKYTQNQQGGGGGGGGGGEGGQEALGRQQKDIISATFKLIRDRSQMDPKEYEEGLKALSLVQGRLQEQAQGLVARLKRRGAVDLSDDFSKLAEFLEAAVQAMGRAKEQLGQLRPSEALPEEQKALQGLLRAESIFREIQISFASQMSGGGGGGSQASAEDLADLFELELNKLKNQYETVQRGEREARDKKVDEALERVKELARRQQQLNERLNQMASRSAGGGGGAETERSQRQLLETAEEVRRQLQQLSRERSSPEIDRASRQLQQAMNEMRRAMEQGRQKDSQGAQSSGARALQQLQDALQAVSRSQRAGASQALDRAAQEARRLVQNQKQIQESLDRLAQDKQNSQSPDHQARRSDLANSKGQLADSLREMQQNLDSIGGKLRQADRDTAARLNDASSIIRDQRLPERVLSGNPMLQNGQYEYLRGREEAIRQSLDELAKRVESARDSMGQSRDSRLGEAAERARRLAEGIESMQQRMNPRAGADSQQAASQAQRGEGQGRGREQGAGRAGNTARQGERENQGQTGSRAGGERMGFTQDAMGPPTGVGPHRDERMNQLQRETLERLADAQDLRKWLDRNPTELKNLEQVINALRAMDRGGAGASPEQISALRRAAELTRQIEQELARELDQLSRQERYLSAEDNDMPPSYRKLVEEYYRALAKGKK